MNISTFRSKPAVENIKEVTMLLNDQACHPIVSMNMKRSNTDESIDIDKKAIVVNTWTKK